MSRIGVPFRPGAGAVESVNGQTGDVDLSGIFVPSTEKAQANGVATLGADSKIPGAQLPALAIGETFTAASQAAMLALDAQRGDMAVRTDLDPDGFFLLTSDSPGTLADWVQITAPGAVASVNGQTGAVDLSGTYADNPTPGTARTALVTGAVEQTRDGATNFASVRLSEEWIDPRHPRFAGGAKCDNVTDDSNAWDAVNAYIGATDTWRTAEIFVPGPTVVSRKVMFDRKGIVMHGRGYGSRASAGLGRGSWFRWEGINNDPVLEFRQGVGLDIRNIGISSLQTDPARIPGAGISLHSFSGSPQGQSGNTFHNIWVGQLLGYDPAPPVGTYYFGAGIRTDGFDAQSDLTYVSKLVAEACEFGVKLVNSQNLLWKFQHLWTRNCGTGLSTVCEVDIEDWFSSGSKLRDLDIAAAVTARVFLKRFGSEKAAQFARMRGHSQLLIEGEYFQFSNFLTGSDAAGEVPFIDAVGDNLRRQIKIEDFDFRDAGYTNPATLRALHVGANSAGPAPIQELELRRVTWGNRNLEPADIKLALPGSGEVHAYGEVRGLKNASGFGKVKRFFNVAKTSRPALDFERDDTTGEVFGDGSDGLTTVSTTVSLVRDMFYDTLTVASGGVINTKGFRVHVAGTCTVAAGGIVQNNGGDASVGTGAGTSTAGSLAKGGDGAAGVIGAGVAGSSVTASLGGTGGTGGTGDGGAGGAGGTATAPTAAQGQARTLRTAALGLLLTQAGVVALTGGGGGGSGAGGGGSGVGGNGGGGGGICLVAARSIINNGTIQANGGAGSAPNASLNRGGGGGGGGGTVLLVAQSVTGTGTTAAAGGVGAIGNGTGTAGTNGSAGTVRQIIVRP